MIKILKKFIDSKDLYILKNWCEKSVDDGLFFNGPPDRYVLRLRKNFPKSWEGKDITDGFLRTKTFSLSDELVIPECIDAIEKKLIKKFNIDCEEKPDVFMSLHKEGGKINKHKHFPKNGFCDLRFNIFINKTNGGDPSVNNEVIEVDSGDLIIFSANEMHHSTPVKLGKRIILSYGFFVTLDFANKIFFPKVY
jgi:hypothetical protein